MRIVIRSLRILCLAAAFVALFVLHPTLSYAGFLFGLFEDKPHFPLIEAADLGNATYVTRLLNEGTLVNTVDEDGNTALIKAAYRGYDKVVNVLIKHDANVNFQDTEGRTALHLAASQGNTEVVKALMAAGARTDILDNQGLTALQYAINQKYVDVIAAIDPKALKVVTTDTAFPVMAAGTALAGGGGGISTGTVLTGAGVAAAGGAAAAAGAGGGGGGSSSSGGGGSGGGNNNGGGNSGGGNNGGGNSGNTETITLPDSPQHDNASTFETPEYNYQLFLNPPNTTSLSSVRASSAYARGYTGTGIVVAVVDTGVAAGHPDLIGRVLAGHDFVNNDNDASDDHFHGTMVAGIVAASRNGSGMHGVAYNAKILPVKVLNSVGFGSNANVAAGIDYAVAQGADIINLSLGDSGSLPEVQTSISNAVNSGVAIVAASGNSAAANPFYPAAYAGDGSVNSSSHSGILIAVGAVDASNTIASFSNRCGSAKDWCLVAPGVDIISTYYTGGYAYASGTSFADPHVAGAAAILMQAFPNLTAYQVGQILLNTAQDLGVAGVDSVYGHGLLDLEKATRPFGTVVIPLSGSATGITVALNDSVVVTGAAFGDALSDSSLSVAILDSYQRAYQINFSNLSHTEYSNVSLDSRFADFATPMFDQEIAINEGVSLGFSDDEEAHSAIEDPTVADANQKVRAALTMQSDNQTISMQYHAPVDRTFGIGALAALDLDSAVTQHQSVTNPFLGLIEKGDGVWSSFSNAKGTTTRFGSFYGTPDNTTLDQTRSGFVADIAQSLGDGFVGLQMGLLTERGSFLGSRSSGALDMARETPTWFYALSAAYDVTSQLSIFGLFSEGTSSPSAGENSLFSDVSPIRSQALSAGLVRKDTWDDHDSMGIIFSQPLKVTSGHAMVDLPGGISLEGNVGWQSYSLDLTPSGQERDIEAFYSLPLAGNATFSTGTLVRFEPNHVADATPEGVFMLKYQKNF